jgi:hypothetical protein
MLTSPVDSVVPKPNDLLQRGISGRLVNAMMSSERQALELADFWGKRELL